MVSLCQKHRKFQMKEYRRELSIMTLESDANVEEKLALGFKNDMASLVNFNARSEKSEDLNLKKMERLNSEAFTGSAL